MHRPSDCRICNPAKSGNELWVTENFKLEIDPYPLTKGHLRLVPINHFSCMGELPNSLFEEFQHIYDISFQFLINEFGKASSFEQGFIANHKHHARTHFLPINAEHIFMDNERATLPNLELLQAATEEDHGYIFLGTSHKNWLIDPALSRDGLFREKFGEFLNVPERTNPDQFDKSDFLKTRIETEKGEIISKWNRFVSNLQR